MKLMKKMLLVLMILLITTTCVSNVIADWQDQKDIHEFGIICPNEVKTYTYESAPSANEFRAVVCWEEDCIKRPINLTVETENGTKYNGIYLSNLKAIMVSLPQDNGQKYIVTITSVAETNMTYEVQIYQTFYC